ncbi:M23 family metallopeptidase [Streptomyces sp. JB150]|uniref:M23 family metallopeptidase n=1 Tax=Streptomyces sp. JB150 TaxID=2714844 RepID=UPI00140BD678|nr:M23 family metallopeptidase [Streptomyces sp. JB150]QIJ63994.1 M23 family metallopeptidase [Streptomyces sp. JB150]
MSPRVTSRSSRTAQLRTRAAVLAAGLGASAVLGAGIAAAAPSSAPAAVTATTAAAKKAAGWVAPVKGYTKTASFAQNGARWQSTHSGQDFAVPTGTKVVAAHGGTVVKAGGNGAGDGPAYGNAVVIKHGNGTYSQYAHLSTINVRIGQIVKTGQQIARSGNTGNSSGPHLHFEIRTSPNYGTAIDPVAFLRAKGLKI